MTKAKNHNYAVILAGGQGSRFWPLSRYLEPKQFLSLYSDKSLFHDTLSRIKSEIASQRILIITNELYSSEISHFAAEFDIPRHNIIFESEGKNTAPAIAVAAQLINASDPDGSMVVLSSDHSIKNRKAFRNLLRQAFSLAESKKQLGVFGIVPDFPATGYGYIKVKNQKIKTKRAGFFKVEKFIEKPDIKKAKRISKNKHYFWNSGMFAGRVDVFLGEIKCHLPSLYKLISKVQSIEDIKKAWKRIESISFDYGVLEKSKNLFMIPAQNLGWSDLGTWASLDKTLPKDKYANSIDADAFVAQSRSVTIFGRNRLIACLGLNDLIIVDTPDALLITRKDKSEDVKNVVDMLKKNKRQEYFLHQTVKRSWGKYTVLDRGDGFKVKLVEVKPGKTLTLQKHTRRSEHWVVLEGKAKAIRDKKVNYVKANESIFIPSGVAHRLENPTAQTLKIVEVQSGSYLEEDDIVRIRNKFK